MLIVLAVIGTIINAATEQDQQADRQEVVAITPTSSSPPKPIDTTLVTSDPAPQSAPTTAPPTAAVPTSVAPGSVLALDLLDFVVVENEHQEDYNRDLFGYPADTDGDGCDTRSEVLLRDSLTPAQTAGNCDVVAGEWLSAYDNTSISEPGAIEVDHVVSLKEAWDSGAWSWDRARQVAFGNDLEDPRSLRLASSEANQSKGEADPSNWIPANDAHVCTYLADWIAIKVRWSLSMDQSEHGRIGNLLEDRCPNQRAAPWPETPPAAPSATVPTTEPVATRPPITIAPPTTIGIQPVLPPVANTNCDPSYPDVCIPPSPPDLDCGEITFRRFTVLPPDPHRFDGDNNGIGCEQT